MTTITLITPIHAPPARCFDLARSADAHLHSAASTHERIIAGPTTGLIPPHTPITFEARHLLFTFRLTSEITRFDPPNYFQDRMQQGPFAFFQHDHHFAPLTAGITQMTDTLRFRAPLYPLSYPLEKLLLSPHLARFLTTRAQSLKQLAESTDWQLYLPHQNPM